MSFYFILTTGVPQRSYVYIYIYISMKQPLVIDRDTGFFEMCPKFFVLKMKFKSTNTSNLCLYECPTYKQVLTIVGFVKFLIKSRAIFFSQFRRKVCVKQGFLIYYPDHSEVKVISLKRRF